MKESLRNIILIAIISLSFSLYGIYTIFNLKEENIKEVEGIVTEVEVNKANTKITINDVIYSVSNFDEVNEGDYLTIYVIGKNIYGVLKEEAELLNYSKQLESTLEMTKRITFIVVSMFMINLVCLLIKHPYFKKSDFKTNPDLEVYDLLANDKIRFSNEQLDKLLKAIRIKNIILYVFLGLLSSASVTLLILDYFVIPIIIVLFGCIIYYIYYTKTHLDNIDKSIEVIADYYQDFNNNKTNHDKLIDLEEEVYTVNDNLIISSDTKIDLTNKKLSFSDDSSYKITSFKPKIVACYSNKTCYYKLYLYLHFFVDDEDEITDIFSIIFSLDQNNYNTIVTKNKLFGLDLSNIFKITKNDIKKIILKNTNYSEVIND